MLQWQAQSDGYVRFKLTVIVFACCSELLFESLPCLHVAAFGMFCA